MISSEWSFGQHCYSLIHYKNCIFHGQIKNSLKQNTGILILDNGQVLIANYKRDQLDGYGIVFIDSETYVIGSYTRGMLDGKFVLRNPTMTVYWTAKMNKIQGEIIVINFQNMIARNWIIQNGQGKCTNQISLIETDKQHEILTKLSSGMEPFGMSIEFLYQKFAQSLAIQSSTLTQTTKISLPGTSLEKVKIILFKDKLIEYGVYNRDQLNGLGYVVQGMNILQGRFKNGKLDGHGLKMDVQMEKIIYGLFQNGDVRSIDVIADNEQVARKQLKNYKRQQHIYSLQYQNNYFNQRPILMLINFLKTIQQNDRNFTYEIQYQEEISVKKEKERSFAKIQSGQMGNSTRLNLTAYKNEKEQALTSNIKGEVFQSRFTNKSILTTPKNNSYIAETPKSNGQKYATTQFSDGISQFNRINKALRKFK